MKGDRRPLAIRFRGLVEMTPSCWLWTGQLDRYGYGRFRIYGGSVLAHRWSFEQVLGPIPPGKQLDHLCRVRHCVNPSHLEVVAPEENTRRSWPATKTHCVKGHEFTPENTYLRARSGEGRRDCRTCIRERARRYKQRRREVA